MYLLLIEYLQFEHTCIFGKSIIVPIPCAGLPLCMVGVCLAVDRKAFNGQFVITMEISDTQALCAFKYVTSVATYLQSFSATRLYYTWP